MLYYLNMKHLQLVVFMTLNHNICYCHRQMCLKLKHNAFTVYNYVLQTIIVFCVCKMKDNDISQQNISNTKELLH